MNVSVEALSLVGLALSNGLWHRTYAFVLYITVNESVSVKNMARTKAAVPSTSSEKARSPSPDPADRPLGPLAVTVPASEREEVKVNNANLTELKNACDDAVKRVCPSFLWVSATSAWTEGLWGSRIRSCEGCGCS